MTNLFFQIMQAHPQIWARLENQTGTGFSLWDLTEASAPWLSPGLRNVLGFDQTNFPNHPTEKTTLAGGFSAKELHRMAVGNQNNSPLSLGFYQADGQTLWLKTVPVTLSKEFEGKENCLLLEHELPAAEPAGDLLAGYLQKLYDQPGQTLLLIHPDDRIRYYFADGIDPELHPESRSRIGQRLSDLSLPEGVVNQLQEALEEARLSDHTVRFDFRRDIQGVIQDFQGTVSVFRDDYRRPFWGMILLENQTAGQEAKRKLQQMESLISRLPDISIVCDSKGRITWANEAFTYSTGYSDLMLRSLSLTDLCGPDMPRQERTRLEEALQHCLQTSVVISRQTGPEPHYQLQLHLNPVFNEVGHCTNLVCCGREITRERNEKAFTETILRLLQQTNREAGIGGWSFEPGSDAVYWSDEVYAIHEVDEDFVPTVEAVITFYDTEDARNRYFEAGRDALQSGIPYDVQLPIRSGKGNRVWVRVRGIPEMEDGQCVRLYGSIQRLQHPPGQEEELPANGPESLLSAG